MIVTAVDSGDRIGLVLPELDGLVRRPLITWSRSACASAMGSSSTTRKRGRGPGAIRLMPVAGRGLASPAAQGRSSRMRNGTANTGHSPDRACALCNCTHRSGLAGSSLSYFDLEKSPG